MAHLLPSLGQYRCVYLGLPREEALYYIKEVLEMIIEEFEEEGTPLPPMESEEPTDAIPVSITV